MLSPLSASPNPLAAQSQRAQTQDKPQTRSQSMTVMEQKGATSSNVAQGRLDKQDAKLLSIAKNGVLGEFSEEFLEGVEELLQLGNSLEDAVAKAKDDQRTDKIARIEQRIEALKERLKFASPAQAKALIRELKQLGQDFKLAAQSLSDGGSKTAAGQPGAGSSITLSASSSSSSLSDASATAVLAEGELAVETANALLGLPAGSDPMANNASVSTAQASGGASAQGQSAEGEAAGSQEETQAQLLLQVREAIATYNSTQVTVKAYGSAYDGSARKQADYDKLRDLEKQIDLLAEQIGALSDRDDEEQRKELEAAKREMDEGRDALNEFRTAQLEAQGMPGVEGSAGGIANLFTGLNGSQGAETGMPAGTSGVSVSINKTAISFASTSVSVVLQTDVKV
ncbi:hypothetical protein [Pannonibacter phragmitetus]|uniref:hypothetical protein n=1 Tax=Pannonibacter phragmitetus TaxID=121719 RepID=UPI003D2F4728